MPRDLFPTKSPSDPIITASPEMKSPSNRSESEDLEETGGNEYSIFRDERDEMEIELSAKLKAHDDLHPHVQVLSISDLDACVALENACFPENEAGSRAKVRFRLPFGFGSLPCITLFAVCQLLFLTSFLNPPLIPRP